MKNSKIIPIALVLSLLVASGVFAYSYLMQKSDVPSPEFRVQRPKMPPGFVADKKALFLHMQAINHLKERKDLEAVKELKQALAIQENHRYRYILGVAQARAGQRGDAIKTLKQVAKTPTDSAPMARRTLGQMERDPKWGLTGDY